MSTPLDNNPNLDGKYIGTITKDFATIAETLKEGAYQLRARKISSFPIFPISKVEIPLGKMLIEKDKMNLKWNYYFSFFEEFTERGIIVPEKEELFKETYKDPDEFCCLFVVDEEFTNFLFVPYPED